VIAAVLTASGDQVAAYRGGKEGVLGYLVGQVMRKTNGRADPRLVNDLLRRKLNMGETVFPP
jgi:Asp-tRNA(Asn)/Glu-tRNA(Gln) amidotransferase B subunit